MSNTSSAKAKTRMTKDARARNTAERARRVFLTALSQGDSVTVAADKSGYTRMQLYKFRRDIPDFGRDWDLAHATLADELHTHAKAIALGAEPGAVPMLQFLLKAADPERFCPAVRAKKWELQFEKDRASADRDTQGADASDAVAEIVELMNRIAIGKTATAVGKETPPSVLPTAARLLEPIEPYDPSSAKRVFADEPENVEQAEGPGVGKFNPSDWAS